MIFDPCNKGVFIWLILQQDDGSLKIASGYPMITILMVLDVFEHAYYIDYKNDRAKFVDVLFHLANWNAVNIRLERLLEQP